MDAVCLRSHQPYYSKYATLCDGEPKPHSVWFREQLPCASRSGVVLYALVVHCLTRYYPPGPYRQKSNVLLLLSVFHIGAVNYYCNIIVITQ